MTLEDYRQWLALARKHSRRGDQAEDLLQDALLVAAHEGRLDFSVEENRKWFSGVLRNRAAMIARSEGRRKGREERAGEREAARSTQTDGPADAGFRHPVLHDLPLSARRLAALLLHGMTRDEILFALDIAPTAYRQRLTVIRKFLSNASEEFRTDLMAVAYYRRVPTDESLERGLIRQALLRSVRVRREVGSHDPDGHLIMFRSL